MNQTSAPFRVQDRLFQRKRFLAVCWETVEAPRFLRLCSLCWMAFSMASQSKPKWSGKFWSSAAITAAPRLGEMSSRGTQVWCEV